MEEILNNLDTNLLSTFNDKGLKSYGYCELIQKDGKVNPVTCSLTATKKGRITAEIHDRFNGIFYHRLLNSPWSEDEDFTFGQTMAKRFVCRMRTVIAYKIQLGEDFIFDFIKAMPDRISVDGYKFVTFSSGTLIADHESVSTQEYGAIPYEKHRTPWNIFALEYDIEFIKC